MAKYSQAPNLRAIFASCGAISTNIKAEKSPPINDANTPIVSASLGLPFRAIGDPSKHVTSDAGDPGMFNSIAATNPPLIPPTYTPSRVVTPWFAVIAKVKGSTSDTPSAAVNPGIAPKTIPTNIPTVKSKNKIGSSMNA